MSEQFKIYIHSPKHHISEQTIRKLIDSVNMIANNLFDGNVYGFDNAIDEEKNFESLVQWASEIAKRNVVLDEKIGELQRENEHQKEEIVNSHKAYVECLNENKELKKENEQLRKELDNFKPVMFQDVRKGTVILYSKR